MTGCSNNEPSQPEGEAIDRDAIRFTATTESPSRADYTTANLKAFNVFAYLTNPSEYSDQSLYMDNVEVTKGSDNSWSYSPVEYWPARSAVDFYAFAPASWLEAGKSPKEPMHYENNGWANDLIYATALNRSKPTVQGANAQVRFNFRHALSKVEVFLRTTEETNLLVRVSRVTIRNNYLAGDFTFPTRSTDQSLGSADPQSIGTWSNYSNPMGQIIYAAMTQGDVLHLNTNYVNVNPVIPDFDGPALNPFVIPQPLTYANQTAANQPKIEVELSIYDAKTYAKLWPNADTPPENIVPGSLNTDGFILFPVTNENVSQWLPGYKYIYNITIDAHSEMGEITFGDPTVDTFIDVQSVY